MRTELAQAYELTAVLRERRAVERPELALAKTLTDMAEVYQLTHGSYVKYEYAVPHPSKLLIHYPYFDHLSETTVIIARLRGKIVGTVSFTIDGPSGLTVDEDFKNQCDIERESGKKVAAVWRLVVDEQHRDQRDIVTSLIRECIVALQQAEVDCCFFSVNPRHANVYKRMLNMEIVARKEVTTGLNNAPAVLLRGYKETLPRRIVSRESNFTHPIVIPILLNIHAF